MGGYVGFGIELEGLVGKGEYVRIRVMRNTHIYSVLSMVEIKAFDFHI